jgi:hypothetical protein
VAASFAQQMVDALERALSENISVGSVTVDGQTVQFNSRATLMAEYDYWRNKALRFAGKRKTFRGINVGSAWNG